MISTKCVLIIGSMMEMKASGVLAVSRYVMDGPKILENPCSSTRSEIKPVTIILKTKGMHRLRLFVYVSKPFFRIVLISSTILIPSGFILFF